MRLVLLTGNGAEHRYVANALARGVGLHAIFVDRGRPQTRRQRIERLWKRYTVGQLVSKLGIRVVRELCGDAAARVRELDTVFGDDGRRIERADLVRELRGINRRESIDRVGETEADCLLVYGTGIVGKRMLSKSRLPALNMHTGISPYYRGTNCAFWPLYTGELHMLGATVHECVAAVDAGKVYATGRATLRADDGLHAVFGRCVEVGAELYVDVAKRLQNGALEGQVQDLSIGREYRAAMRGLREELAVRRMIRRGDIRRFVERGGCVETGESPRRRGP